MGRSRSSSGGGSSNRGSLFGRSKPTPSPAPQAAPSRSASTMAAPAPTRTVNPAASTAHPPAPVHNNAAATTAPQSVAGQQVGTGGGLLSGLIGGVVQGMAFGTGSAIAHRAVDAVAGPRTVVHEHRANEDNGVAQTNTNAPTVSSATSFEHIDQGACRDESSQFRNCLSSSSQMSNCQFLFDVLSQCRTTAQQNKQWS